MERLVENQSDFQSIVLASALAVTLLWEMWFPRRGAVTPRAKRWRVNFLLMFINMLVAYAVVPVTTVALALVSKDAGWGLLNHVQVPFILAFASSVLLMDLARYGQHWLMHRLPVLWRIHRVHHADPDLDVTSSLRFHPIETLMGVLTDSIVIVVFGVPAVAVVLYRMARVFASTIVHGNVRIPPQVEAKLRRVLVTPDMHRIHHSVLENEQRCNLSGGLSWWDHLFGTYVPTPSVDYRTMQLGLSGYPHARSNSLRAALVDPFKRT